MIEIAGEGEAAETEGEPEEKLITRLEEEVAEGVLKAEDVTKAEDDDAEEQKRSGFRLGRTGAEE